jgi:hypothetical protein
MLLQYEPEILDQNSDGQAALAKLEELVIAICSPRKKIISE